MASEPTAAGEQTVKQCCAQLYESDLVRFLLGDSFHPGGLNLTKRLGEILQLTPETCVLDVACGKGTSAVFLAEHFGCHVTGIDYSDQNVAQANALAAAKGMASRVRCERADAERLGFMAESFDAVICECAFCTFPDKSAGASEFARVLRLGGRVGLSDITRGPNLPQELDGLLARIACIADAQPTERYQTYLRSAGLDSNSVELHNEALTEMIQQVRNRLLGAEILTGLEKLDLPGVDFLAANQMAKAAHESVKRGQLGYVLISAVKL
jgi:ubiquinone/menaquinone biosynthesis C-methylase UbiE